MCRHFFQILLLILCVCIFSSCQSISSQTKRILYEPVNCDTAVYDIEHLKKEKANKFEKFVATVKLVTPINLIFGAVTKDIDNRAEVANGQYTSRIDDKITAIEYQCGLVSPPTMD